MKYKASLRSRFHQFFLITLFLGIVGLMSGPSAHAGLTFDLRLIRDQQGTSYNFYTPLATNSILPAAPLGTYLINSPQQPTNGSWRRFELTATGLNDLGGGSSGYGDFTSVMGQITNGNWTIVFTNATTTNYFQFTVSAPSMTSNMLPATSITFPTNGSLNVTNQPTFTWQGPASWGVNIDAFIFTNGFFFYYASLPAAQNAWTIPTPIPSGPDRLVFVRYITNYNATLFVASTPLDTISAQPLSGWDSSSALESHSSFVGFSVSAPPSGSPTLFGHYTFDDEVDLEEDSSGLGNHAVDVFYTGSGTQYPQYNSGGISGGAVEFDGFNAFWWETDMVDVLAGSYSISLWLETTQSYGNDDDDARNGATIFAGDTTGDFPVPMALTGEKLGFHTAVPDHTINSGTTINSGNFTHLVVTRDAATGMKRIYVDGVLDVSDTGGTTPGIDSGQVYLGYSYYSGQGIVGLVDDLQVYTGVLSLSQIDFLHNNPGITAPPDSGISGGHTNIAHYRFDDGGNLGLDDSGNNNHFSSGSSWGLPVHEYDQVGAVGSGGVRFYGVSSMVHAPPNPVFTNITTAIANSFSLSLWVRTEEVVGTDTDDAFDGAVVIYHFAGVDGNIPVSITGNKVAFHTGDEFGNSDTLHSTSDVTDGNDHHIVVTRDRPTGVKKIYVDGILEATATNTTRVLNGNTTYFSVGGTVDHDFDGTVDDLQIYSGVLSASEVTNLFNNPGSVAPDTTGGGGATNIAIALTLSIHSVQPPGNPEYFLCLPFSTITPAPITTHEIRSPNSLFSYVNNQPSSGGISSFGELMDEITNGVWTIYFNKNHPNEQQFTFSVSAAGVTTNLLQKVTILSPTNGSTGVPSVPTYSWSGASGLQYLSVALYQTNYVVGSTNPPPSATTWINPPPLAAGTNQLDVVFYSIGVTNFSFTMPVDSNSVPLFSWITRADLQSSATSFFVVVPGITPVQLSNPNQAGGNFQFQFLSETGKTNTVQSRTNLALGVWINRTNILGDGNTKIVILPISSASQEFFRVSTQ